MFVKWKNGGLEMYYPCLNILFNARIKYEYLGSKLSHLFVNKNKPHLYIMKLLYMLQAQKYE